jgi:hypothetical protein
MFLFNKKNNKTENNLSEQVQNVTIFVIDNNCEMNKKERVLHFSQNTKNNTVINFIKLCFLTLVSISCRDSNRS